MSRGRLWPALQSSGERAYDDRWRLQLRDKRKGLDEAGSLLGGEQPPESVIGRKGTLISDQLMRDSGQPRPS